MMRKILAFILCLAALFSFAACEGEYHTGLGGSSSGAGNKDDGIPEMNDDPTDDFTVTVLANGEPYIPTSETFVYWTKQDGLGVHTAKLDENGVARTDGLDGDYKVTLSFVPKNLSYDPNTNIATNDAKNITVNLYTVNNLTGSGDSLYNCYNFKKTGVYTAVLESSDDAIYFEYAPESAGTYSIESWVDITADNVNPYVDVYGGSFANKYFMRTIDDGGAVGSYTVNFLHEVRIAKENISAGGQATYTFVIKADTKDNKYPVTVTFAVKRDGEFELSGPGRVTGIAIPEYDFTDFNLSSHEYGSDYKMVYAEERLGETSNYVFDETRFKLYEKSQGGDGFYHVYDPVKYAENNGYGPILYAAIKSPTRFIDRAFTKIEYSLSGETLNSAISNVGGINYKHFIEGYTALSTPGAFNGGSYYCVSNCTCHKKSDASGWACTDECTNCKSECRRIPKELVGFEGYQAYCNSDGYAPVTQELYEFLLGYCHKETLFYDGKGTIENRVFSGKTFQAIGDSGWLFACAYYEKIN